MTPGGGQTFKIKLAGGRVLGPLDLERVRRLILKNKITGSELARRWPDGEWVDISQLPELAELLMAKLEGRLETFELKKIQSKEALDLAPTQILPGATQVASGAIELKSLSDLQVQKIEEREGTLTQISTEKQTQTPVTDVGADAPVELASRELARKPRELELPADFGVREKQFSLVSEKGPNLSQEKTVLFQRSSDSSTLPGRKRITARELLRATLLAIALGVLGYESFFEQPLEATRPVVARPITIRPKMPTPLDAPDPQRSQKLYSQGMRFYVEDTVQGYVKAAGIFLQAASHDITNVKALAMLASCYLNLIDSSNKDEKYFSVISKLIEMSRAKSVDLPETIIADVEFFLTANKPEAAQHRIVEYTKKHQNFGIEMFFYLAYAFYGRGDAANAARYISQFPDNKIYSAKIYHLRGLVAEKLNAAAQALEQYQQAVSFNPRHTRSRLRIAALLAASGKLDDAEDHLKYIVEHPKLSTPRVLAEAYYLQAQFYSSRRLWDMALGSIERAVKLERKNHDYLLELYTLRGRVGDNNPKVKTEAKMFYFLGEGERLLKEGRHQEALVQFMQARQANLKSALPLVKIGDMFLKLQNIGNARLNYEEAAKRAPQSIDVWSKYVHTLIESYDWQEAQKAVTRLRGLPVSQSAIDKIMGDLAAKQGQYAEAQIYYKRAMSRRVIDPQVYLSYANNLMKLKDYENAPFFYALALRFDPLNSEAIIGTAKSIAASESIDRAVQLLQDELQKGSFGKAELLSAIAELQIQKGEWELAQRTIEQAMAADPEHAQPWRLQAQIHKNNEGRDKKALDKALEAYKSYSDRNLSDPSGYLERYHIFAKKAEFEQASEELNKIFAIYPKYPALHHYRGTLYFTMGNHRAAVDEFQLELTNNPTSVPTLIAAGKAYLELGAPREALERFNKAMQLAPRMAEPKHLSGYANYLLKNFQGAIALYNAALAFDRANPLIHKRLGMAYRDMGDRLGASKAFRKYLEMEPDAVDRHEFQSFL